MATLAAQRKEALPAWGRAVAVSLTGVLLCVAAVVWWTVYQGALARGEVGWDAGVYRGIGSMWLATGEAYYPVQFAGPYPVLGTVNMYPPFALYLFAPMSLFPTVLWWVIPLSVLVWHVIDCRPRWWAWPILAGMMATLPVAAGLVYGNTEMWTAAAVAVACRFSPAAWFLVIKPTVLPVALLFARDRRWWLTIPVVILAAIPLGDLWVDWATAMLNVEHKNALYSLPAVIWLGFPLVARTARPRTV
jgi:hypothetical protein